MDQKQDYSVLINLIQKGEKELFEVIVNDFENKIFSYCLRFLNFNKTDAQDAASQTFINFYLNILKYDKSKQLSSYLYRIAHNVCVDIIRAKSPVNYILDSVSSLFSIDDLSFSTKAKKQEDNLNDKMIIESVLNKLAMKDKDILILYYLQENSIKEIAEIYNLTTNTTTVKLKRARERAQKLAQKQKNLQHQTTTKQI